jgi:hypothetical protein
MYSPVNENTTAFMKAFSQRNSQRTGQPIWTLEQPLPNLDYTPSSTLGMVPAQSESFIYDYVLLHPNCTRWAVTFAQSFQPHPVIQYQIWYNASLLAHEDQIFGKELVSFLRGMDEAIISAVNDPTLKVFANMDVSLKEWPLVPAFVLSDRIVQNLGPMFFFCCVMVIFINALNQIVTEKETNLRHAMEMMGLWVRIVSDQKGVYSGHFVKPLSSKIALSVLAQLLLFKYDQSCCWVSSHCYSWTFV